MKRETTTMPTSLEDFQRQFMEAVLGQDDSILKDIKPSSKEKRETLLNVYQHAYGARLEEFLGNDYPLSLAYTGEELFSALCTAYASAHPSDNPNARWYGRHFPGFLQAHPSHASNPEIAELASLEQALNNAFDAKDEPPLTLVALTLIAPDEWGELTFKPHPSTCRLTHNTNAAEIWAALSKEQTPPGAMNLENPGELIIWRGEKRARYRPMAYDEAMIWDQAMKGANFAALCEMLGTYWPEEEAPLKAAGYLQAWIGSEFLIQT